MSDDGKGILGKRDATSEEIRQAMGHAINAAVREHKRAGHSVVVWEDGRITVVPPEEIRVPDEDVVASEPVTIEDRPSSSEFTPARGPA
jgi:hypothetical protein